MAFLAAAVAVAWTHTACRADPHHPVTHTSAHTTMGHIPVPQYVRRLAVWYSLTSQQDLAYGYSRLEQAAFELKTQRPWIRIIERRNVEPLTEEQRLQVSGRVAEDSGVAVGKWLGADSMVLFRIEMPMWRDRLLARFHERMPPIVVSSKIISVESGEVLYHDVVTINAIPASGKWGDYAIDYELQPALHSALDQALSIAITHLNESFR